MGCVASARRSTTAAGRRSRTTVIPVAMMPGGLVHTGLKMDHSAYPIFFEEDAGLLPNETYLCATGATEIRPLVKPQPYRHSSTITLVRLLNAST